jgi:hypothetical protein
VTFRATFGLRQARQTLGIYEIHTLRNGAGGYTTAPARRHIDEDA